MMPHEKSLNVKPPSYWKDRIIFALIVSFCFVGLLLATGLIWSIFFSNPPVEITALNPPLDRPVCPGQQLDLRNKVIVQRPTVLNLTVSVMDSKTDFNYPNTAKNLEPRPHPHPSEFTQMIPWFVPNLPPGHYVRVLAIRGHNFEERPLFIYYPFTISEDC